MANGVHRTENKGLIPNPAHMTLDSADQQAIISIFWQSPKVTVQSLSQDSMITTEVSTSVHETQ